MPCLPLPVGEVAERSEDGEGKQCPYKKGCKPLSVTCGDSSPKGRAKTVKESMQQSKKTEQRGRSAADRHDFAWKICADTKKRGRLMPPLKREVAKIARFFAGGIPLPDGSYFPVQQNSAVADVWPIPSLKGLGRKRPSQSWPIPQSHRILKYACDSPLCKGAGRRLLVWCSPVKILL